MRNLNNTISKIPSDITTNKTKTPKKKSLVKPKKTIGRPPKLIDYDMVKALASIMATQDEVASVLRISARTLNRSAKFRQIYKEGVNAGKTSLRRRQFNLSDKNVGMAIFLGKNYLGQRDDIDSSFNKDGKLVISVKMVVGDKVIRESGQELQVNSKTDITVSDVDSDIDVNVDNNNGNDNNNNHKLKETK